MKYFYRYVIIDGWQFPFENNPNGISSQSKTVIQSVSGNNRPIIQVLGNGEYKTSFNIKIIGKGTKPEAIINSYQRQKNKIESLRSNPRKQIKIIFPDGETRTAIMTSCQSVFQAQNLLV